MKITNQIYMIELVMQEGPDEKLNSVLLDRNVTSKIKSRFFILFLKVKLDNQLIYGIKNGG